ncbi:MAG: hypothetical protein HY681_01605 [Chloroflexi bacterium]|nr:hypothetical protein [Chloroflexota bacterium]
MRQLRLPKLRGSPSLPETPLPAAQQGGVTGQPPSGEDLRAPEDRGARPAVRRGPGNLLTISLEGTSLRVLAFRGGKAVAWIVLPFNPLFIRNGFVANPEALATVVRNALNSKGLLQKGFLARLRPWRVAAAFPSFQSASRVIAVPQAKGVNPAGVIDREARRWMNFTPEDHYLFWQEVSRSGAQRQYFALSVPKTPLQTFINTLRLAGLSPSKIVLKPQALASLVTHERAVLANVENNSIDIAIVVNGVPMVMRSVFLGNELLNSETAAPRLTEELNRTITYHNDTNRDAPIPEQAPIYLSGALASDRDVMEAVERDAGLKCLTARLPVDLPPDYPVHQLVVNAALAAADRPAKTR